MKVSTYCLHIILLKSRSLGIGLGHIWEGGPIFALEMNLNYFQTLRYSYTW